MRHTRLASDVGSWEGFDICDWEPFASLRSRCDAVTSALRIVAQQGAVIAVTHGTSGIVLIASLLERSVQEVAELVPLPTGSRVRLDRVGKGEWTASSPDGE